MRIGNPIGSLQTQRQLSTITKAFSRSLERLSSGKRINSAKDGAAELAISSGLEAQQRGLRQIVRNINDARGYGDTLAGVISTQSSIVQRMKELAIQSANGILNSEQRSYLNNEFQQLYSEFSRLGEQTEFNGEKIADGSFVTKKIQVGTHKGETIDLSLPSLRTQDIFVEARGSGEFDSAYFKGYNGATLIWNNSGDFNNDGLLDLVGSVNGASTYIKLALGDGTFTNVQTAFTVTGTTGVWTTAADINNDGNNDLIQTTSSGVIVTALGNGDGTFQSAQTIATATGNLREIQAADLDGDGYTDLVNSDFNVGNTISVFYGNSQGTFDSRITFSTGSFSNYGIEILDLDKDGKKDIVAAGQTQGSVFLNQGSRSFSRVAMPIAGTFVDFADLNNDGDIDMVFARATTTFFGYALGNGNGTFQTPVTYDLSTPNTYELDLGDLNGDEIIDVVVNDVNNGSVYYAFGKGDGSFSSPRTLATDGGYAVYITDTNKDGVSDIVLSGGPAWRTYLGMSQYVDATNEMSIASQDEASNVLAILDNALGRLSAANATIGALMNRLDSSQSVSLSLSESLAQAQSQIVDTDYAEEMAEFTRLQILQSAAIAVMNQNQLNMKLVLKLLG